MKMKTIIRSMMAAFLLTSCAAPSNIAYIQDMPIGQSIHMENPLEIKFKPKDKISILVSTKDPDLRSLFSLYSTLVTYDNQNTTSYSNGQNGKGQASEYTVNDDGTIDFPVLGYVHVEGMSRQELQRYLKNELRSRELVKDAIVTVDFSDLYVTVIGSIGTGRVQIDRDEFTLIDAIAKSGDLDINGKRENIKVIRENHGLKTCYEVNICSADDLYNSPVYYLQQNDVIYVEPNNKTKRTSTEYGSRMVNYTFWTGLVTTALTMVALFK